MIDVSEASEATGTVEEKPKVQSYKTTSGIWTNFLPISISVSVSWLPAHDVKRACMIWMNECVLSLHL